MAEQLAFPLPRLEARGRDAFFVSPANALAVAQVEAWGDWPDRKLVLVGPAGSGKSHLAAVWAERAGATVVDAGRLAEGDVPALASGPVAVEDADRLPPAAEPALFHLHNLVLAGGHALLVTARSPARDWPVALPDLRSRMEGTASATLPPPDDPLLAALLVKLFADRQIAPPPRLIDYCVRRMDRSFAAAAALVDRLDRAALATGRPLGVPLAAEVLGGPAG